MRRKGPSGEEEGPERREISGPASMVLMQAVECCLLPASSLASDLSRQGAIRGDSAVMDTVGEAESAVNKSHVTWQP